MAWLNYHHLLYFWTVARTGSVTRACEELHLSQPAISAQIRTLERSLGERLFAKSGRTLVLTEVGQLVYRYADEIFRTGRELQETLAGRPSGRPVRFTVGVTDAMPKLVAYRLLEPADRKSTRLNSSHANISYAVFCLKKKHETLIVQHRRENPTRGTRPLRLLLGANIELKSQ